MNISFNQRIKVLKTPLQYSGKSVLYIMTRDQRVKDNFGLYTAQRIAIEHAVPLAVVFSFLPTMPHRAREHFDFMLAGLRELEQQLATYDVPLIALFGKHTDTIKSIAHHTQPIAVVTDFLPLHGALQWQHTLAETLPICIVDSHNVVPVWHASNKQEYGARTLRPKIHAQLPQFLDDTADLQKHPFLWPGTVLLLDDLHEKLLQVRDAYHPNNTKIQFVPGERAAQHHCETFISHQLTGYAEKRNNPTVNGLSNLSPYLHFGQIASISVVRQALAATVEQPGIQKDVDALIEEMVIRKELSDNFCFYNKNYDSLTAAPEWALRSLQKHQADVREYCYNRQEFGQARTHDDAWNAAQRQLLKTGKMHGYMRMYWAKKVLEWSNTPQEAHATLIYLNDFYSIDGGDPNGYVGILWSIAGLHDRPWAERPVYGTVRSMVYNGLKRKFAIEEYIKQNI